MKEHTYTFLDLFLLLLDLMILNCSSPASSKISSLNFFLSRKQWSPLKSSMTPLLTAWILKKNVKISNSLSKEQLFFFFWKYNLFIWTRRNLTDVKIQYSSIKAIALSRTPTTLLNLRDVTVYKVLTFKLLVSELISNQLSGMSSLLQW